MSEALRAMGMTAAFDPAQADFTGITDSTEGESLFISAVRHKAFVAIDEEGTEAAAATGVALRATMARPIPTFRADHPFIFLIRDRETGSILFLGRVVDPR